MEIWPKPGEISPNPVSSHQIEKMGMLASQTPTSSCKSDELPSSLHRGITFVRSAPNPSNFLGLSSYLIRSQAQAQLSNSNPTLTKNPKPEKLF